MSSTQYNIILLTPARCRLNLYDSVHDGVHAEILGRSVGKSENAVRRYYHAIYIIVIIEDVGEDEDAATSTYGLLRGVTHTPV